MDYDKIKKQLSENMSQHRYQHSLSTADAAVRLARMVGCDEQKAYTAGLLHDCAKDIPFDKQLELATKYNIKIDEITLLAPHILHAPVGAALAKDKYGLCDEEIYQAIACHTTGKEDMSIIDKVLFVADLVEENRNYEGIEEIRSLSYTDFEGSLLMCFDKVIGFVLYGRGLLHPSTVNARNYLLKEMLKGEK